MNPSDFERDLNAWLDDELPPEQAARMQAAADASPELAQRVAMERVFHVRVKHALQSDPGSAETVRAMAARARAARPPGRVLGLPRWALNAAAAASVVWAAMWWFCVPPFECSYLQALERASHDSAAVADAKARDFATEYGMPHKVLAATAETPPESTRLDFWVWHLEGVRQDYHCPSGAVYQVVVCESPQLKPSVRRHETHDGLDWWIADIAGRHVVAFEKPGDPDDVCAVTSTAGSDSVYTFAKALRKSFQ